MTTTRRSFLAGAVPTALVPAFSGQLHAQESHPGESASALPAAIAELKDRRSEAKPITSTEREARIARIAARYDQLSAGYQAGKGGNDIPLS